MLVGIVQPTLRIQVTPLIVRNCFVAGNLFESVPPEQGFGRGFAQTGV
ncbi:MAG UNVERIFIED_CONTAM: hypothetical protein LVT10_21725 [Anaerolineae bacterium]